MTIKQIIAAMQELRDHIAFNERMTPAELEQIKDLIEAIQDGLNDYEQ
jgi:hypothetical protein